MNRKMATSWVGAWLWIVGSLAVLLPVIYLIVWLAGVR